MSLIKTQRAEVWFRETFKLPEDDPNFNSKLNDLKASLTGKDSIPVRKLAKKTFELVLIVLQRTLGVEIESKVTESKKEIYLRLKVPYGNLKLHAEFIKYPLEISVNEEKRFPFQVHSPFGHYTQRADSKQVYKSHEGDIFKYTDKVRILKTMMSSLIDFEELKSMNLLISEFPLHTQDLNPLSTTWLSLRTLLKPIDIDSIKDYFGEKIALYFAWLEFYTTWLIIPSIIGAICGILIFSSNSDSGDLGRMTVGEISFCIFAILLSISSTLLDQLWVRKQSVLAWKWGVSDYQKVEEQRAGFQGDLEYDPITGKTKKINHSSLGWRKFIGATVTVFFIALVVVAVSGLIFYKAYLNSHHNSSAARTVGILNAVQIKIFNLVYKYVAVRLNDWENYETQSEYMDALTGKLFCFQFINGYISLFYIAFVKKHLEGCTDGDCLHDLSVQLGSIYITNLFLNLLELGIPLLKSKLKHRKFKNTVLPAEEHQNCMAGYDEPSDDYMEIVIGYGYVVLFGVAFPFTPLLSLFLCIIEMKVDSYKLCRLTRRPYPTKDSSIGIWLKVTQFIAISGVITNVAILIFTSDVFDFPTNKEQWIAFFLIEHILLMFKYTLSIIIPDSPEIVEKGIKWTSRISNEKIYERFVNVNLEKTIKGLTFDVPDSSEMIRFEDIYKES